MAELAYVKLGEDAIAEGLSRLPGWNLEGGMIRKTFEFDAYLKGAEFVSQVAKLAEELDHHPDIHLYWRRAEIAMNTHAVEGISPYDLELARRIERLS